MIISVPYPIYLKADKFTQLMDKRKGEIMCNKTGAFFQRKREKQREKVYTQQRVHTLIKKKNKQKNNVISCIDED